MREEGQVELLRLRRPTDLARARLWQTATDSVNTILQIAASSSRKAVSFSATHISARSLQGQTHRPLLVLTHLDAQLCPAPWLPVRQLSADSLESIRE
jgi:hypothetical protein